jgi:hypothetical protein
MGLSGAQSDTVPCRDERLVILHNKSCFGVHVDFPFNVFGRIVVAFESSMCEKILYGEPRCIDHARLIVARFCRKAFQAHRKGIVSEGHGQCVAYGFIFD